MNYLGVDWGKSKIGLAVGDSELRIASPFGVVGKFSELMNVIKEEEIDVVILGRPKKMSGNDEFLDEYDEFVGRLSDCVRVDFVDERLTTKEASGLIRGFKKKGGEDDVAAMLILQGWLDKY